MASKNTGKHAKLVRDSFTIPKAEFATIDLLKTRAITLGTSVKKSELLRAGLMVLKGLNDAAYKAAIAAVPTLKTGRPSAESQVQAPAAKAVKPAAKVAAKASVKPAPKAAAKVAPVPAVKKPKAPAKPKAQASVVVAQPTAKPAARTVPKTKTPATPAVAKAPATGAAAQ